MAYKPTIVLDFDGVIHSYTSGWRGITVIPDPVVPGIKEMIDKLRSEGYEVVVVSTRCKTEDGIVAISSYLFQNNIYVDQISMEKPPAVCYVDDRAICFRGNPEETYKKIKGFKTWLEGDTTDPDEKEKYRSCRFKKFVDGMWEEYSGKFHCWTQDYEELGDSVGHYPAAIVETDDGKVLVCSAENLQFTDR